jgi:hypothetical protein
MLVACSTDLDTSALFLAERSQNDLSYINYQSQSLFEQFKERAGDRSQNKTFLSRMKRDFQKVQGIDDEIWTAIEDLEEVKANVINEWTGEAAEKLVISELGGKNESIVIYDLSKTDNSETSNYSSNSENGKNLQEIMVDFRKNLTEKLARTSNYGTKEYTFNDSGISDFKDFKDLKKKTEMLVNASHVSSDDRETIIRIYMDLSLSQQDWSNLLPEETSYLNVFNSICHLEKIILKTRQEAFELMGSRYCIGEYNFNKILPVAYGKNIVSAGDTVEIQVTMAAFNSYSEPIVKCTKGKAIKSSVRNGMGTITFIAPEKGEQKVTYSGTITVKNKSGVPKTVKWEKEVWVKE